MNIILIGGKMKKIFLLMTLLFAMSTVAIAKPSNRQLLQSMHKSLNVICRAIPSDSPSSIAACRRARTTVSTLLRTISSGKSQSNGELALSIYSDINEMCRGGSGDEPSTAAACDVRNKASMLMKNMGYCWCDAWWKKCRS